MQRAKDTFFVAFRNAIATANPERTTAVRGVLRPAVVVEENELSAAVETTEVFRLRWTEASLDTSGTVPLARLRCEVRYETAGTVELSGMDRGRVLSAMDRELRLALCGPVQRAPKMDYSAATPTPAGSQIFWGDPEYGAEAVVGDRVGRTVVIDVWSLEGVSQG